MKERGEEKGRRPSAGGGAEDAEALCAMASMAPRKPGSERSGSGGGEGRRGYRRPSGLHWHCPVTVVALVVMVAELPVSLALLRSDRDCGKGLWRRQT